MRRKVYLIGGFALGWKNLMRDILKGVELESKLSEKRKIYSLSPMDDSLDDTIKVYNHADNIQIEFTVLKWNDLSSLYYNLGFVRFWKRVWTMYRAISNNADTTSALQLPRYIVNLFVLTPFLLIIIFLFWVTILGAGFVLLWPNTSLWWGASPVILLAFMMSYLLAKNLGALLFLRGFMFLADASVLNPQIMNDPVARFKERVQNDLENSEYDEICLLGFSHGAKFMLLLLKDLLQSQEQQASKIRPLFVAQTLPLALVMKPMSPIKDCVEWFKKQNIEFINIINPKDRVSNRSLHPFFPLHEGGLWQVRDCHLSYEQFVGTLEKLKIRCTLHYAHKLYFKNFKRPCEQSLFHKLLGPGLW